VNQNVVKLLYKQSDFESKSLKGCIDSLFEHHKLDKIKTHEWKGDKLEHLSELLNPNGLRVRQIQFNDDVSMISSNECIVEVSKDRYVLVRKNEKKLLKSVLDHISHSGRAIRDSSVFEVWTGITYADNTLYEYLVSLFGGNRKILDAIIPLITLSILLEISVVVFAYANKKILDSAVLANNSSYLLILCAMLSIFVIAKSSTNAVKQLFIRDIYAKHSFQITESLFKLVIARPIQWFDKHSSNDIHNRTDSSLLIINNCLLNLVERITNGIVAIIGLIAITYYVPFVFLICIGAFLVHFSIRYLLKNKLFKLHTNTLLAMVEYEKQTIQVLSGIPPIKMAGAETSVHAGYDGNVKTLARIQFDISRILSTTKVASETISAVVFVLLMYILVTKLFDGNISIGTFFFVLVLFRNYDLNAMNLLDAIYDLQEIRAHILRVITLSEQSGSEENQQAKYPRSSTRLPALKAIQLKRMAVKFDDEIAGNLHNINLIVDRNRNILITGSSGSGKSLIAKIIAGEIEPTNGQVKYITDQGVFSADKFHNLISFVHQDDFLFTGSILDNITMGEITPSMFRVEICSRVVGIESVIDAMPMQYNTVVGVSTDGISGGQTQRLLIARALYHQPKVLILDEATSNLDIESERKLLDALNRIDCIIIYISGRKEMSNLFDQVIDLDESNL